MSYADTLQDAIMLAMTSDARDRLIVSKKG